MPTCDVQAAINVAGGLIKSRGVAKAAATIEAAKTFIQSDPSLPRPEIMDESYANFLPESVRPNPLLSTRIHSNSKRSPH
jgi:hypothetical protein